MVQYISPGNIFGRIGSELGRGLSEQIPKEAERTRLSQGLQALSQKQDLTPFQRFAELSSMPGITPQMIQSGSDLLRQEAQGKALNQFNESQNKPKPNPFKQEQPNVNVNIENKPPSLTQEQPFAKAQEGFIPRTEQEKFEEAGKKFNANPQAFGGDPQKAIDYENQVDLTNAGIAEAYQTKHENLSKIQDNVVNRLRDQSEKLGTNVPADVYSKIEDEAIQATKPKSEGGQGLTEDQAKKIYGKKLDDISRDYKELDTIGDWSITGRKAKNTLQSYKALQKKFAARNDTRNMADQIVARNNTSYPFAYSVAEPVSNEPLLYQELKSLPDKTAKSNFEKGFYSPPEKVDISSRFPKLLKALGEKGSPLAVGYELEKKGYDSDPWYDYLNKNSDNLKKFQVDQIEKTRNQFNPLNDWWLSEWTGLGD